MCMQFDKEILDYAMNSLWKLTHRMETNVANLLP
jgi:hypothetical protein